MQKAVTVESGKCEQAAENTVIFLTAKKNGYALGLLAHSPHAAIATRG